MKITAIRAHAVLLKVELDITSPAKTPSHQACVVEIETDAGITGHGITSIGPAVPIKAAVDEQDAEHDAKNGTPAPVEE